MPQANSTTSTPRVTEPRASSRVLPCSDDTMRASSSRWSRRSIWNRNRIRARAGGAVAAQSGKADRAAATAASTSLSEARGTRAWTAPVEGSKTSPKRFPLGPDPLAAHEVIDGGGHGPLLKFPSIRER